MKLNYIWSEEDYGRDTTCAVRYRTLRLGYIMYDVRLRKLAPWIKTEVENLLLKAAKRHRVRLLG